MSNTNLLKTGLAAVFLALCASACEANTLSVNIADYNAAQVALAKDKLTVPANFATYAITDPSVLAIGDTLTFTLPEGFTFTNDPTVTNTGTSTFTLTGGGAGMQSAMFTVSDADLVAGQSVSLDQFSISGAGALETLTPVADALQLTVQAQSDDSTAYSAPAFASEPGISTIMVGAIQFVDTAAPSFGRRFQGGGGSDPLTVVIDAVAIQTQTSDAATHSVPVLSANGQTNSLNPNDTASVTFGGLWTGYSSAFSSFTSDCAAAHSSGTVTPTSFTLEFVPLNKEDFGCIVADGVTLLPYNFAGFGPVIVSPGVSKDFLGAPAVVEFAGLIAYTTTPLPPVVTENFANHLLPLNGTTRLTFTVSNANPPGGLDGSYYGTTPTQPLSDIVVTDNLPAGMSVATPNGVTSTCDGTVSADPASSIVALSGASFADGGMSCTFSVDVIAGSVGTLVNTIDPPSSTESGPGLAVSDSVVVVDMAPPVLAAAFNPSAVPPNTATQLIFTLTNPASNSAAELDVGFTDELPAGLSAANTSASACGGSLTVNAGLITLSGATVDAGSECQFSISVTPTGAAHFTDTTSAVTSSNGGTGNAASATLDAGLANLQVTIDDFHDFARYGQVLNYLVTVHNIGATTASGVSIMESLSADFDVMRTQWICIGGSPSTSCTASGTGALSDANVLIPASDSLTWLITAPVQLFAPDATGDNAILVTVPNDPDSPYSATDSDTLVPFRDGFESGSQDGTGARVAGAPNQQTLNLINAGSFSAGDTLTLNIPTTHAGAIIDTLIHASASDGSGFRIERLNLAKGTTIRLVSSDSRGIETPGAWVANSATSLTISLANVLGTSASLHAAGMTTNSVLSAQPGQTYQVQAPQGSVTIK